MNYFRANFSTIPEITRKEIRVPNSLLISLIENFTANVKNRNTTRNLLPTEYASF